MENKVIGVTAKSFLGNQTLVAELMKSFPNHTVLTTGTDEDILGKSHYALVGREPIHALTVPPQLKTIVKYGVGLDNVDLEFCQKAGISVFHAPGVNRDEVVEQTLGLMIGMTRNLFHANQEMHQGTWIKNGGKSLSELCIGIIGAGNVGGQLAEVLARVFRPKLLICDIADKSQLALNLNAKLAGFEECLRACDVVSFHVPLTTKTRNLFSEQHLPLLKPGCILINTSRGEVLSESALVLGLERGLIHGAALDVFDEEPLPLTSKLRSLDHVVLTPHIAGNSQAAVLKMGRAAMDLLKTAVEANRYS